MNSPTTITYYNIILDTRCSYPISVGPCHHGMGRQEVADGGKTSNMDSSCEYIE